MLRFIQHFEHGTISDLLGVATGLFLAVIFIQSGLDKITGFKGNLDWLNGQFSKTIFRKTVAPLLITLLLLETAGGLLCAAGAAGMLFGPSDTSFQLLLSGHFILTAALLALMFGQRISKEYAGAAGLTGYILIALLGLAALLS